MNRRAFCIIAPFAALALAQGRKTFTGVITDSMCPTGDHSEMQMGSNDAECATACVGDHGASYMLYDGKTAYFLSDQKTPEKLAGKKVIVTGTFDAEKKIIQVETMIAVSGNAATSVLP